MVLNLKHHSADLGALTERETSALLACARGLREAPAATTGRALRGKNLCLLSTPPDHPGAATLQQAATALGALVASVPSTLSEHSSSSDIQDTSRLLGRLYDGVVCAGVPSELVRRIAVDAGVPVFDDIAAPDHPLARLATELGPEAPGQDNRCLVIQALLLCTLV